ncbi:SusC/RagA family TonB-linked outer membrane protein [Flavihumibacter sp. RY-1]|uniref:SusC/RagA family TonB-linked outer membrane protein n=1 Tax=Flavihumibacter fluminis TaxID=2909236 RepID=A0ABS9BKH0_9BACT|nr:SusC/RagA family TonB-linked outer membrane protein [Flavihumibacter fluminis]MCF1715695.1 SusC/RagA family TonB-linked outer membrane protein [Flavihumibacter fluminis]
MLVRLQVVVQLLLAALCVLCPSSELWAQERQITGVVLEQKTGQPLEGATITLIGANRSVLSDADGRFKMQLPPGKQTITISFVDFETARVSIGEGQQNLVLRLTEKSNKQLSDVVVVGYQKQSLKKTTSAVQVVSGKSIENMPAPSFDQLLQGKVSGINIQNFSGEPGVRNTFTVRGNSTIVTDLNSGVDDARTLSTPLYVIDGIPISITDLESSASTGTNYLAGINVNDIESIVVQKDAAATAVWGSRGANGVIVIKTKRGKAGKPQMRFSYYTGLTQKPNLMRTVAGAEERWQKLGLMRDYGTYQNLSNIPQVLSDSLNPAFNNATDWQDLFYQSGLINNADVNISAGSDLLNYRLGINYYDEDGIIRQTGFKRYSIRGNFDFKVSKKFNVNLNLNATRSDRKRGLGRGRNDIVPINAATMPATFYALSDADKEFYYGGYDKQKDKNQTDAFSAYVQANYDIVKGIQYSFQGSLSSTTDKRNRFQPGEITPDGRSYAGSFQNNYMQYYLANILTGTKTIGDKHNFGMVLTQSFQLDDKSGSVIEGFDVPDDNIQVVSGIQQRNLFGYSYAQQAGLLSFMGQLSYDYDQKYILNLSWRGDASSRFGNDSKWGYFPAVSAAYIVSDEKFLQNVSWIDLLKIRGSYGLSGSMPDDFYAPYNVWDVNQGLYNGTIMATPSFQKPVTLPNLTWNKSDQTNIGFDLFMFKNRVNLTVDFYRRNSMNPILNLPFPFFTGYTSQTYNASLNILNEGIDIQLQTRNLGKSSPVQWTTNLNMSFNKNRISSLPNGNRTFFTNSYNYNQEMIFAVGQPIYTWAQMRYSGVYNNQAQIPVNPLTGQPISYFKTYYPVRPGFPIWEDVNNDWDVWSDEDKGEAKGDLVATGNPNPKLTGGLYNEFTYKNFSLGILCTYTIGRDIINNHLSSQFQNVWNFGGINNFAAQRLPDLSQFNYWVPGDATKGDDNAASFPSLSPYGPNYYQFLPFSTMWNENGSYFKIRNISLGYNFNRALVQKLGVQNIRLYSIVDNIYNFQKANVPDAELVSPQGEYRGTAYPLPRKYTLGFEVLF